LIITVEHWSLHSTVAIPTTNNYRLGYLRMATRYTHNQALNYYLLNEGLIMVKLELTQTEFNYLMGLLDKRGDVLMKRTSKQSEYELAQIDYLTFKLSQTEEVKQ